LTGIWNTTAENSFNGAAIKAMATGIQGLPVFLYDQAIIPIARKIMNLPGIVGGNI